MQLQSGKLWEYQYFSYPHTIKIQTRLQIQDDIAVTQIYSLCDDVPKHSRPCLDHTWLPKYSSIQDYILFLNRKTELNASFQIYYTMEQLSYHLDLSKWFCPTWKISHFEKKIK